jgi:hypothetical protein
LDTIDEPEASKVQSSWLSDDYMLNPEVEEEQVAETIQVRTTVDSFNTALTHWPT